MSEPWKTEQDARLAAMEMALKVAHDDLASCREALEAARPIVKARLADQGERDWPAGYSETVLDKIEAALSGQPVPK